MLRPLFKLDSMFEKRKTSGVKSIGGFFMP